jgi:hypothetical protein
MGVDEGAIADSLSCIVTVLDVYQYKRSLDNHPTPDHLVPTRVRPAIEQFDCLKYFQTIFFSSLAGANNALRN